jgi:hypothetical protein
MISGEKKGSGNKRNLSNPHRTGIMGTENMIMFIYVDFNMLIGL